MPFSTEESIFETGTFRGVIENFSPFLRAVVSTGVKTRLDMLKNLTHPVCNARFYYCFHPGNPDISCHIWATGLILPRGKTLGLVNSMEHGCGIM